MAFSHLDTEGNAYMVDISEKTPSKRAAKACATITFSSEQHFLTLKDSCNKKGDVLTVAKLAGIQAAKLTAQLIPLCHSILMSHIDIQFQLSEPKKQIEIISTCKTNNATGIEMEALTAVSIAALTIYDMCKAFDKNMIISDIKLLEKTK
jgi:cyclic pyranopterin phosphate synthase